MAAGCESIMTDSQGKSMNIEGPITVDTVPAMVGELENHLFKGASQLDLSNATEVDSSAVALLLEWQRQAESRGIHLTWTGVPPALQKLATLYGVQELLTVSK